MKIELTGLQHTYPSGKTALDGVDLVISGNEPVAIIGQNGAGKTTLAKHLNGILRPTSGSLLLDGMNIEEKTTAEWSKKVGYVFQNPDDQLFLETVAKELGFGPRNIGVDKEEIAARLIEVAEIVGLTKKLHWHPFDLTATEKKFCTIGAVMMMKPEVIVFDEPTCGQDAEGNHRLRNIVRELGSNGTLCITISHDMSFVTQNFSRVVVMHQGKVLLDDCTRAVFSQPHVLEQSYVSLPPIARVAHLAGVSGTPFTVTELVNDIFSGKESSENG